MSNEEHEQFRRAILKQRNKADIKRLGLPGMSHRAVAVELRRAVRRMEVRDRILKLWEEQRRAAQQPEEGTDRARQIARKVLDALKSGGEMKARAQHYLGCPQETEFKIR